MALLEDHTNVHSDIWDQTLLWSACKLSHFLDLNLDVLQRLYTKCTCLGWKFVE